MKQPFVEYADFECILKKVSNENVSDKNAETVENSKKDVKEKVSGENTKTGIVKDCKKEVKYQSHEPVSYFTKFVSIDPSFTLDQDENFEFPQKQTYTGTNAAEHFLDYVQTVADKIFKKYIDKPKDMVFSDADKEKFEIFAINHLSFPYLTVMKKINHPAIYA